MLDFWIFLSVVFPVLTGIVAFLDKSNSMQRILVLVTGVTLMLSALMIAMNVPSQTSAASGLAASFQTPILVLDFALLASILFIGFQRRKALLIGLAAVQLAGVFILKTFFHAKVTGATPAFTVDGLAATMLLVVSFVGPLIAYYADGYMKAHEEHLHLAESRRPRFFALMFVFMGAMNGLSLADDLSWMFFFWEVTTVCSYLLIAHDATDEAYTNAMTALVINVGGGVAFVFAMLFLQRAVGTLSLTEITQLNNAGGIKSVVLMIPMVALCFAGFTKAAQIPFQSWLCGAMVAPTPVSALLHSSTMVKAGVYLILRMAPLHAGTAVSSMVAVFGAFTFVTAAAFAVGQNNAKKVLAYSTISNLGLIVACAGINTDASLAAGMMLLIFHAISKALLFLCVGTIEQKVGSRDIESMRGLFTIMPRTALLTTFGILSMMLPPFGMLLAKWMALEASMDARAAMPAIVAMLALGSGLTILFWSRWAGIMFSSASPSLIVGQEEQSPSIARPMKILAITAGALSLMAPVLYLRFVLPGAVSHAAEKVVTSTPVNAYALYVIYPIFVILAFGFWYAWREAKKYGPLEKSLPYAGGMQAEQDGQVGFIGPMKQFVASKASNYYLQTVFNEDKLTRTVNTVGIVLLAMLLGGVLQ